MSSTMNRRTALKQLGALGVGGLTLGTSSMALSAHAAGTNTAGSLDLSSPEKRIEAFTKIVGSIGNEEKHAFLRFHMYGYMGENVVPFFSMNNYVVQKWEATSEPYHYQLKHYEVGYFTEFDTDNPISHWKNPVTGKTVELETFILGPIGRMYTPQGVIAPGLAPKPLRIDVIGDRVYAPSHSIESFPNMFSPDEWPELSSGPKVYWDSMSTYSAPLADILNPQKTSAKAEIHMQNLTSWQPFLRMGQTEGRSMARAFGQNIAGFHELDPKVRKDFEKYTPSIFNTDAWTELRFDSMDFYNKAVAEKKTKAGC